MYTESPGAIPVGGRRDTRGDVGGELDSGDRYRRDSRGRTTSREGDVTTSYGGGDREREREREKLDDATHGKSLRATESGRVSVDQNRWSAVKLEKDTWDWDGGEKPAVDREWDREKEVVPDKSLEGEIAGVVQRFPVGAAVEKKSYGSFVSSKSRSQSPPLEHHRRASLVPPSSGKRSRSRSPPIHRAGEDTEPGIN